MLPLPELGTDELKILLSPGSVSVDTLTGEKEFLTVRDSSGDVVVLRKSSKKLSRFQVAVDLLIMAIANRREQDKIKAEIFAKFMALGGIYVKFLQMLALNEEFMRGWSGPAEFNVFEFVPYDNINIALLLDNELGSKVSQIAEITQSPVASGSFAQVYRARLVGGEDVVVKVLRPSVIANLKSDLKFIGFVARLVDLIHPSSIVSIKEVARELKRLSKREVNYDEEVANINWFYDYFGDNDKIIVPKVFASLSTKRVIVEEYIHGLSLATAMQRQTEGRNIAKYVQETIGSDVWEQLTTLGGGFLASTLNAKFIFGDPHPGNIILMEDNKVGLIDFGIVVRSNTDPEVMTKFIEEYLKVYEGKFDPAPFAIAFLTFFDNNLMQAIQKVSQSMYPGNKGRIKDVLGVAINNVLVDDMSDVKAQQYLNEFQMTKLFNTVVNKGNRFGIKLDPAGLQLHKSMMIYISMTGAIGRKEGGNRYLISRKRALEYALAKAPDASISHRSQAGDMDESDAYETVVNWLAEIANKDPMLYKSLGALI